MCEEHRTVPLCCSIQITQRTDQSAYAHRTVPCVCELESVSIGSDNHMYACVNVLLLSDSSYTQYQRDPIILIKRPNKVDNSDQFLVGNITS